jgi:hypothetical protein
MTTLKDRLAKEQARADDLARQLEECRKRKADRKYHVNVRACFWDTLTYEEAIAKVKALADCGLFLEWGVQ